MVPLCIFISLSFYAGISQKGSQTDLNLYCLYEAAAACSSLYSPALHPYSTSVTCLHPSAGRDPALTGPHRTSEPAGDVHLLECRQKHSYPNHEERPWDHKKSPNPRPLASRAFWLQAAEEQKVINLGSLIRASGIYRGCMRYFSSWGWVKWIGTINLVVIWKWWWLPKFGCTFPGK